MKMKKLNKIKIIQNQEDTKVINKGKCKDNKNYKKI